MTAYVCELAGLHVFSGPPVQDIDGSVPSLFEQAVLFAAILSIGGYLIFLVSALIAEASLFLVLARNGHLSAARQVFGCAVLGPAFSSLLLLYDKRGVTSRDVIAGVLIGVVAGILLGLWWYLMTAISHRQA
jgi:ABC-type nitrate/sulfonate/bicarbonate transport system permease component